MTPRGMAPMTPDRLFFGDPSASPLQLLSHHTALFGCILLSNNIITIPACKAVQISEPSRDASSMPSPVEEQLSEGTVPVAQQSSKAAPPAAELRSGVVPPREQLSSSPKKPSVKPSSCAAPAAGQLPSCSVSDTALPPELEANKPSSSCNNLLTRLQDLVGADSDPSCSDEDGQLASDDGRSASIHWVHHVDDQL